MSWKKLAEVEFGEPWADVVRGFHEQGVMLKDVAEILQVTAPVICAALPELKWRRVDSYRGKTRSEWAERLGITKAAMDYRVRSVGWERAVTMSARRPVGDYLGAGITQWAQWVGITPNAMRCRVRRLGWEAAVAMPVDQKKKSAPRMAA